MQPDKWYGSSFNEIIISWTTTNIPSRLPADLKNYLYFLNVSGYNQSEVLLCNCPGYPPSEKNRRIILCSGSESRPVFRSDHSRILMSRDSCNYKSRDNGNRRNERWQICVHESPRSADIPFPLSSKDCTISLMVGRSSHANIRTVARQN